MPERPKILFIHRGASSFVKEDIKILQKFCSLYIFHFQASKSLFVLIKNFIRQFYWLIKNLRKSEAMFCWFSDYHAFLPVLISKLFNIPIFTVLGGFDCNKIISLNYGIFCSKWRTPLGKYIIHNSTLLLPVDKTLISTNNIAKNWGEAHPNGITHNIQHFNTNWKAIPTGYDSNVWQKGPEQRSKVVSTVALCSNLRTALIKGWDIFIEVSKLMPDFTFQIIGAHIDVVEEIKKNYSPNNNLIFIPPQKRIDLVNIYQKTSVYLQLSRAEGLPNVLCEAMLCGCVPIGSTVFGIPGIINEHGFLAGHPEPHLISQLVLQAHDKAPGLRDGVSAHIAKQFPNKIREKKLKDIFNNLEIYI